MVQWPYSLFGQVMNTMKTQNQMKNQKHKNSTSERREKNAQQSTNNTRFCDEKKKHKGNNFGVATVFEAFKRGWKKLKFVRFFFVLSCF